MWPARGQQAGRVTPDAGRRGPARSRRSRRSPGTRTTGRAPERSGSRCRPRSGSGSRLGGEAADGAGEELPPEALPLQLRGAPRRRSGRPSPRRRTLGASRSAGHRARGCGGGPARASPRDPPRPGVLVQIAERGGAEWARLRRRPASPAGAAGAWATAGPRAPAPTPCGTPRAVAGPDRLGERLARSRPLVDREQQSPRPGGTRPSCARAASARCPPPVLRVDEQADLGRRAGLHRRGADQHARDAVQQRRAAGPPGAARARSRRAGRRPPAAPRFRRPRPAGGGSRGRPRAAAVRAGRGRLAGRDAVLHAPALHHRLRLAPHGATAGRAGAAAGMLPRRSPPNATVRGAPAPNVAAPAPRSSAPPPPSPPPRRPSHPPAAVASSAPGSTQPAAAGGMARRGVPRSRATRRRRRK